MCLRHRFAVKLVLLRLDWKLHDNVTWKKMATDTIDAHDHTLELGDLLHMLLMKLFEVVEVEKPVQTIRLHIDKAPTSRLAKDVHRHLRLLGDLAHRVRHRCSWSDTGARARVWALAYHMKV